MNDKVKKGFKIICLDCESDDCYFGTYGGVATIICSKCGQQVEESE